MGKLKNCQAGCGKCEVSVGELGEQFYCLAFNRPLEVGQVADESGKEYRFPIKLDECEYKVGCS